MRCAAPTPIAAIPAATISTSPSASPSVSVSVRALGLGLARLLTGDALLMIPLLTGESRPTELARLSLPLALLVPAPVLVLLLGLPRLLTDGDGDGGGTSGMVELVCALVLEVVCWRAWPLAVFSRA